MSGRKKNPNYKLREEEQSRGVSPALARCLPGVSPVLAWC